MSFSSHQTSPIALPLVLTSLLGLSICLVGCRSRTESDPPPMIPTARDPAAVNERVEAILAEREQLDRTVWADEKLAEQYEASLVRFWDQLIAARADKPTAKLEIIKAIPIEQITVRNFAGRRNLAHGIEQLEGGETIRWSRADWLARLDRWHDEGLRLEQSEWHHARFDPAGEQPARSEVSMAMHLNNTQDELRVIVRGILHVVWAEAKDAAGYHVPQTVNAGEVEVLTHSGPPWFEEIKRIELPPRPKTSAAGLHPLIVDDLDNDGLNEVVLAGQNLRLQNLGRGDFSEQPLLQRPAAVTKTGLIDDFSGDGLRDFVTVDQEAGLLLFRGDAKGQFVTAGEPLVRLPFQNPQVMTAGDIDKDGDLDLWIGQHKSAYLLGQMPTPYYDANDGFPAYLLRNDGDGRFTEITAEAGLEPKRYRRTYGGCLVDLDQDGDLDLMVISDFAGIDIYRNDGSGKFQEATTEMVDEWHSFGMSATFGDYNGDGQLDFFISGMASNTARRLDHLQAGRDSEIDRMRPIMAFGSRMYLGQSPGSFRQPAYKDQVARTGWTWGATSFDFDNDGDRDLYLANGHSTGKSTRDHCWHFWCHDIYTNSSQVNPLRSELFKRVLEGFDNATESWDGYQKNRLMMNMNGAGFVNVAYLLGVAAEYDARAVVGDDLDNDGRVDLLVTSQNAQTHRESLHIYRNIAPTQNNWIGVRVAGDERHSPLGAVVRVHTPPQVQVGVILAGDSYSAQHPGRLHFGLGEQSRVERIEVHWSDGTRAALPSPEVNQYHSLQPR